MMTAFVIAGALSWIGRWYHSGGEYTAAQVAEQCIGTLMHGVLGPGHGCSGPVIASSHFGR